MSKLRDYRKKGDYTPAKPRMSCPFCQSSDIGVRVWSTEQDSYKHWHPDHPHVSSFREAGMILEGEDLDCLRWQCEEVFPLEDCEFYMPGEIYCESCGVRRTAKEKQDGSCGNCGGEGGA